MYQVAVWLVFADVVLQFYFAGVGVFTVPGNDFSFHARNATVLLALLLATLVVSLLARPGWRRCLLQLLLPVLLVLQVVFFIISDVFGGSPGKSSGLPTYIASLHVVNGLLILGLAGFLALRARSLPARPGEAVPIRPTPGPLA
jgi:Family of unknown function (DUF6220)